MFSFISNLLGVRFMAVLTMLWYIFLSEVKLFHNKYSETISQLNYCPLWIIALWELLPSGDNNSQSKKHLNPNHAQCNKMQQEATNVKSCCILVAISREQKNHCSSWWILLHWANFKLFCCCIVSFSRGLRKACRGYE